MRAIREDRKQQMHVRKPPQGRAQLLELETVRSQRSGKSQPRCFAAAYSELHTAVTLRAGRLKTDCVRPPQIGTSHRWMREPVFFGVLEIDTAVLNGLKFA